MENSLNFNIKFTMNFLTIQTERNFIKTSMFYVMQIRTYANSQRLRNN